MIGFIIGAVLFLIVRLVGYSVVERTYVEDKRGRERELALAEELQSFVTENELSSSDTERLAEWVKGNSHLYVMLYKDEQLLFDTGSLEDKKEETEQTPEEGGESVEGEEEDGAEDNENSGGTSGGITVTYPTRDELIKYAMESGSHLIETSDGHIFAYMTDYSQYLYYDIINIASGVLFVISVFVVVLVFFNRMTARITRLAGDVNAVAGGDMTRAIRTDGRRDEISRLGENVENMRSSILSNVERIKEAQDANAELITAMSHDIRTPLTVLMGYIDLMKEQTDDEVMASYVNAAEKTAARLKKLSDDMFGYFLVFSGENVQLDVEEYDAYTLFEQMIAEHVILLKENGFKTAVQNDDYPELLKGLSVSTDASQLSRIFENIFSNLLKYADKSYPVSLKIEVEDDNIVLSVLNKVSKSLEKKESNGIGLRSCRKIAEMLGHTFLTDSDGNTFTTTLAMKTNVN